MRIGVHSGRIISGIIGFVKYQFDIWSKDVDIANKMESEGEPGSVKNRFKIILIYLNFIFSMVHITNITKALLQKPYTIEATNKGDTVPQFKANGYQTFLVKPVSVVTKFYF